MYERSIMLHGQTSDICVVYFCLKLSSPFFPQLTTASRTAFEPYYKMPTLAKLSMLWILRKGRFLILYLTDRCSFANKCQSTPFCNLIFGNFRLYKRLKILVKFFVQSFGESKYFCRVLAEIF